MEGKEVEEEERGRMSIVEKEGKKRERKVEKREKEKKGTKEERTVARGQLEDVFKQVTAGGARRG